MKTLTKEQLAKAYEAVWKSNQRMIDYCVKTSGANIQTDDGLVWDIDKPSIETHFCFGERGYDYEEVAETCRSLSKDEHYFRTENIRRMEAYRLLIRLRKNPEKFYWSKAYSGESKLVNIRAYGYNDDAEKERFAIRQMTSDEIEVVTLLLKKEVIKFFKRLNTYLKRYGLSKCRYWTYWAEA